MSVNQFDHLEYLCWCVWNHMCFSGRFDDLACSEIKDDYLYPIFGEELCNQMFEKTLGVGMAARPKCATPQEDLEDKLEAILTQNPDAFIVRGPGYLNLAMSRHGATQLIQADCDWADNGPEDYTVNALIVHPREVYHWDGEQSKAVDSVLNLETITIRLDRDTIDALRTKAEHTGTWLKPYIRRILDNIARGE